MFRETDRAPWQLYGRLQHIVHVWTERLLESGAALAVRGHVLMIDNLVDIHQLRLHHIDSRVAVTWLIQGSWDARALDADLAAYDHGLRVSIGLQQSANAGIVVEQGGVDGSCGGRVSHHGLHRALHDDDILVLGVDSSANLQDLWRIPCLFLAIPSPLSDGRLRRLLILDRGRVRLTGRLKGF